MALIICSECGKEFSEKAAACPNCGCPIEDARKSQLTVSTKFIGENIDTQKTIVLRDYLEKIRTLETDIYTMGVAIEKMTLQIKPAPQKQVITPPSKPLEFSEESAALNGLKEYGSWILYGSGILERVVDATRDSIKTAITTSKSNRQRRLEYQKRMEAYEKAVPEYEKALRAEDVRYENECAQVTLFNKGIAKQVAILSAERNATEAALQRLYSTNVIYPKYRGIVPITMFCEYMNSGRRTELEGVHGMYDLYEMELLGKQIVDKLSDINRTLNYISYQIGGISSQLVGIQRNQILLYEEVARGNEIATRISQDTNTLLERSASMVSAMSNIVHEIGALRTSSEMTAFNTEATARRVDAIAKIEEYEYSLRHPMFPSV